MDGSLADETPIVKGAKRFMPLNSADDTTQEVAMTTLKQRVREMFDALGKSQVEFGELAGASRALVNQWLSGETLNIGARFAFKLEANTGYKARWIILGVGDKKQDELISRVAALMETMPEDDRRRLLQIAEGWAKPAKEEELPPTAIIHRAKSKKRRA